MRLETRQRRYCIVQNWLDKSLMNKHFTTGTERSLRGIHTWNITKNPMIESFLFYCRARGLTPNSIRFHTEKLSYLTRYAQLIDKDIYAITKRDVQTYIVSELKRNLAATTINGTIKSWKGFYRFLIAEGLLDSSPLEDIQFLRTPMHIKPIVSPEKFRAIIKKINGRTFYGSRNIAMLIMAFETMVRLSELTGLKYNDLKLNPHKIIIIRAENSKSRKDRIVSFSDLAAQKLVNYYRFRKDISGPWLFPTKDGRRLERRNCERIFERAGKRCGIHICPQMIRRSGATAFILQNNNPHMAQRILGHKSFRTTENFYLNTEGVTADIIETYNNFSPLFGSRD